MTSAVATVVATATATLQDRFDGPPVDVQDVLDRIERILSDPLYAEERKSLLERLLGPLYGWLERMIAWVTDKIIDVVRWLFDLLTTNVLGVVGPLLVVAAATAGIWVLARRRAREIERRATIERILELGSDPGELEAQAVEADQRADHAEAIRLRFVAGLLRLDQDGVIDFYPGLSNGAISQELRDPTFDRLASQFDRVVYGRRPAGADDSRQATDDWMRLHGARR